MMTALEQKRNIFEQAFSVVKYESLEQQDNYENDAAAADASRAFTE